MFEEAFPHLASSFCPPSVCLFRWLNVSFARPFQNFYYGVRYSDRHPSSFDDLSEAARVTEKNPSSRLLAVAHTKRASSTLFHFDKTTCTQLPVANSLWHVATFSGTATQRWPAVGPPRRLAIFWGFGSPRWPLLWVFMATESYMNGFRTHVMRICCRLPLVPEIWSGIMFLANFCESLSHCMGDDTGAFCVKYWFYVALPNVPQYPVTAVCCETW